MEFPQDCNSEIRSVSTGRLQSQRYGSQAGKANQTVQVINDTVQPFTVDTVYLFWFTKQPNLRHKQGILATVRSLDGWHGFCITISRPLAGVFRWLPKPCPLLNETWS